MLLAITKKNLDTLFYFLAASSCQQQPVFVNGSTWRKLVDCGLWTYMATICLVNYSCVLLKTGLVVWVFGQEIAQDRGTLLCSY